MHAMMPAVVSDPPSLGLKVVDTLGQLQIQWNRNSDPVRRGTAGVIEIADGGPVQVLQLDPVHLQAGNMTYARRGEKVDVSLIVFLPDGARPREVTSFLGKLPDAPKPDSAGANVPKAAPEDPALRKQRDALLQQNAKLRSDLAAQADRARRLEKSLEDARKQLRLEQRRRMGNQNPDK
jgi:hypothetical protein